MNETFSGFKAAQQPDELATFIDILRLRNVKSFLEVGSRHGDTLYEVGVALGAGSKVVSIDLPGKGWGKDGSELNLGRAVKTLSLMGIDAHLILGNSQSNEVLNKARAEGPYDAVLLDGDHRIIGVSIDWANYKQMAKIVAFHDIAPSDRAVNRGIRVQHLWHELKQQYRHVEIKGKIPGMGIGVLFLED